MTEGVRAVDFQSFLLGRGNERRGGIDYIIGDVRQSLQLWNSENYFAKGANLSAEELIKTIANGIWDLSGIEKLGLARYQKTGLLYPWGGRDPNQTQEGTIIASAQLLRRGFGIIRFSPKHLQRYLEVMLGDDNRLLLEHSPRSLVAHEMYHLYQLGRYPNASGRHTSILASSEPDRLSKWGNTTTERGAKIAGRLYEETILDAQQFVPRNAAKLRLRLINKIKK